MDAVNEDTISHYFALLKQTLEETGLTNSPGQLYNVNESGVPLHPRVPNIVTKKGTKKVRYQATDRKGQITIVPCGSATGQVIPPTVISVTPTTSISLLSNENTVNTTFISTTSKTSTPSPLSDYLMYRVTSTPTAPKRSVPQPMLLTSDESLAVLEEKENAKKAVLLEKERRRAEKKQQREDLSIKKREEKARKAEEKVRIQQEKARKQQEKAKAPSTRGHKKNKGTDDVAASVPAVTVSASTGKASTTNATNVTTARVVSTTVATVTSVANASVAACRRDQSGEITYSEVIDPNKCCMCFVSYEDDVLEGARTDWIFCKCGRWLHEDCVEDVVVDSNGEECFCSFCIDKYTI